MRRHLPWVLSAARRQVSTLGQADEVCRAVFAAAEKSKVYTRPKRYEAEWLFRAVAAAAKHLRRRERIPAKQLLKENAAVLNEPADSTWRRVSGTIDQIIASLNPRIRRVAVPSLLAQSSTQDIAQALRFSEPKAARRAGKAARLVAGKLRRIDPSLSAGNLAARMAEQTPADTEYLSAPIIHPIHVDASIDRLARKTLSTLWWAHPWRWFRRLAAGVALFVLLLFTAGFVLVKTGRMEEFASWAMEKIISAQMARSDDDQWPPKSPLPEWATHAGNPRISAAGASSLDEFYQTTNVWSTHFVFDSKQWEDLGPGRVRRVTMMSSGGGINLVNTNASRNGLAGVLGYEFPWSSARLELGGITISNVGVRFKGNGTYWGAAHRVNRPKRPYKVNLAKQEPDQNLAGAKMLNFGNLVADGSSLNDALGYEYFREIGVPAPRTAYAFVSITIAGQMERRPLGLYVMVENLDSPFLKKWYGSKKMTLFKPVTLTLFKHLGDDWKAYERIYDPKTKASPEATQRVIDFAKLVTNADDATFGARVGEFIDLEAFAKFIAGLTLQSSYDGFLNNGQNYFMVHDPESNRFSFIPWDLDHSWGEFPFNGTPQQREESSLFHPWVGENRLLERMLRVAEFKAIYRKELERQLATHFIPARLLQRVDEIAAAIRPAIQCESASRLSRFERSVQDWELPQPEGVGGFDAHSEPFRIKRFIAARAASARDQLDGKTAGHVMPFPGGPKRPDEGEAGAKRE